ncbi:ER membrane protein DP1/Yop1 [Tulasnella sp. 419]|nr:ER membrane protein DP1/Yop1 [Tulasnella sp. 418]KAG8958211.1 ER membrane protein DP1/Yop1 [Tulasnella sp. 419]
MSSDHTSSAQARAQATAQQIKSHPVVVQAQDRFNNYIGQLDKELSRYPVLNQIEERTQVPKAYGVLVCATVFLCLIFINSLALPVSNLVGWGFPAYLSFKAIESPGHEDDLQWLTYWVTFGFFTFIESIALRVVLYYVPWYFPLKTAFVLWLQLPTTKGARTFYISVIRPVMANFQNKRGYNTAPTTSSYTTSAPVTVPDYDKTL